MPTNTLTQILSTSLTNFEEFSGGSCGTKYRAMLGNDSVLIKVAKNENPDPNYSNALSSESEYIFFKWISDPFQPWPAEIVEPRYFGSLPPNDPLFELLNTQMFRGNLAMHTNVDQLNMFVAILPLGDRNEMGSDGHEEVLKAFLAKFRAKAEVSDKISDSKLLQMFKVQMDHKKADNSIKLNGAVKLIDFGKWGEFTYKSQHQITILPEYYPKWYDQL